jgi:hypothetical protein
LDSLSSSEVEDASGEVKGAAMTIECDLQCSGMVVRALVVRGEGSCGWELEVE